MCMAATPLFADVFRFLALTGLRQGELFWLTRDDIDIERRVIQRTMGFGAEGTAGSESPLGEMLSQVGFYDLVKFGLIPEFIGRFPVVASLQELSEKDLVQISGIAIVPEYKVG